MNFIPILVCVLPALLSTGYSLSCISCVSTNGDTCTGPNVTCPQYSDRCSSIYTKTNILPYGLTTMSIVRGCGYSKECAEPTKTLNNQFMSVDICTSCCEGDNCTPVKPKAPSSNPTPNGLQCPSCFALMSDKCAAMNTTQCAGGENKCVSYVINSVFRGPFLAMSGCATENLCSNYNGTTTSSEVGEMKVDIACMNATVVPSTSATTAFQNWKTETSEGTEANATSVKICAGMTTTTTVSKKSDNMRNACSMLSSINVTLLLTFVVAYMFY
ncbi:phospholipase A2 inhibitor NAI-like [Spea bombifrons]|uniref:phospholipase A2 inhibitor NAI-like n=1 Tax=Spea bombifrons TaxID=233779 RepID=UPI00234BBDE1|nr:phospholipase A2 inhibitor NAI-like [Spea bombifrons]